MYNQASLLIDKSEVIVPVIDSPLWWQKRGLSYTATGYGKKIPTSHKIEWNGKKYRVYCCIFSNSGTCYIISKGQEITVDYFC
jgi:hypothetical protein